MSQMNIGGKVEEGVTVAWDAEIAKRIQELDSCSVKTIPWEQVRERNVAKIN